MTLPSVLVTDTNIWVDLENGKILADVFRLPYQFFTTDFAVEEFIHPRWATLQVLGLQTHGLEPEYILELIRLRQLHRQLSAIDLAALLLARALGASLVTGDRRLNELAKAQGVPVHGVLWILDEMVIHHVLTSNQAAIALRKMLDQGARLPGIECQKRFDRWS
ncbi:MAG: type II toxin-antitoxin system VapC family toxin [Anaerolineae bacterium]|nr:type II toxin-antitoxin system VapC family toxin [Anaerolineae bacterium]